MNRTSSNFCYYLFMQLLGRRTLSLIIMISIATGFSVRGRLFNKFGRFQSLYASSAASLSTQTSHPSYNKVEDFHIKEYGLKGSIYSHKKSGAQVISVIAPDDNKVFGITFRTPPADSTGVPHILEHSVLCGSRKYPVKEPFAELLRGSLQNFLNAFTYPDRTCYPVASTNTKDFYNLVNVYLDAVLNPRAVSDPQVLEQEGWHYELETPQDPLSIKGVVFNEMKGVYSSPDALLDRATQQALFPHNTYGVDSGGDPNAIPKLTFDQFKSFHQTYYHPSNSRIFFYGDDDPEKRLDLLDEYLKDFNALPAKTIESSRVQWQKKFQNTLPKIVLPFPITSGNEPKHMTTVNWVLNDKPLSQKDHLAINLLDYLLLGTPTSDLRKALLESNLGEKVIGGGLSDELLQATYSIGLKGVKPEDVSKVEELVFRTLEKVSKEGFPADAIEAAVNSFEFRLREFNTGSYPKGLSVMLAMTKPWIYDRSPLEGITFEEPLAQLKEDIKNNKPIFQELIKQYLLQNHHRVTVEMVPDVTLESKQQQEEQNQLAQIKSSLSSQQIEQIISNTKALREAQEREDPPEAKATLPRLTLEDIDPKAKEIPITVVKDATKGDDVTLLTHPLTSSGILYADLLFDYSGIDLEDVELLPLFTRLLMESGTKNYDETKLTRTIGANTGGISVSSHSDYDNYGKQGTVASLDDAKFYLVVRGKATKDKIPVLFDLIAEILVNAKLDNAKKAVEILRESKATKESRVISAGHSYAATRLAARDSILGYIGEKTGGVTSVRQAGSLLQQAEKDWPALLQRLEKIREKILTSAQRKDTASHHARVINLTGDEDILQSSQPTIKSFLEKLPAQASTRSKTLSEQWKEKKASLLLPARNEGFSVPSLVNYVVYGGNIYKQGEQVPGSVSVVSRFLSNVYLWDSVRVVGGAYGGFAQFSDTTGRFVYLSYRDPNLMNTIEVYKNAPQFLSEAELSSEDLLQSIIGTVGELDSPDSVDHRGYASMMQFIAGETSEYRQRFRNEVLKTSQEDFKAFAERITKLRENGSIIVFGSQQALETANQSLEGNEKLVIEPAIQSSSSSSQ